MHTSAAELFLLAVAAALSTLSAAAHAPKDPPQPPPAGAVGDAIASCMPHEGEALLDFKQGITSDPAGMLDSWSSRQGEQDCCRWRGVRCSDRTGHVLRIELGNGGYGSTGMIDQISPSLLSLQHLEHLDLSYNYYLIGSSGAQGIPEFLGSLKNLNYLNLSGILFLGSVPPQLGNLTRLQYLDLSMMGGTSSMDLSWVTHLRVLRHLDLGFVNLSAAADWAHAVSMLPSLEVLGLSACGLTSASQPLPRLDNLTNLEHLDLSFNILDHPISSCWFWNLTGLSYLSLAATNMYGQFPSALGGMASLQVLDVSDFYGWGNGTMMPDLNNLCSLEVLDLSFGLLDGDATKLFESLPARCTPSKLQRLSLGDNSIHGVLPEWLGQFTSLETLILGRNNITGRLPASIGNCTGLVTLDLSSNHFSGQLPAEIGILGFLTYLHVENNGFDGVVTEEHFASLKSLQELDMSYNPLSIKISSGWRPPFRLQAVYLVGCQMGPLFPSWLQWMVGINMIDISSTGIIDTLPDWFAVVFSNVTSMNISNNQLTGGLPAAMETMSLEQLYLNSNQLTGQIPPLPPNLSFLDISMNSLSGPLPSNLGAPNLESLSLSSNRLTGRIPTSICECVGLKALDLANNSFEGEPPPCLGKLQRITTLQLSKNSLSGEFPSFLQNYKELGFLDIASNKFSGRLPLWIENMVELGFLRLSHNMFSGNIPTNMENLQCLSFLDVADNSMSGPIPRNLLNLQGMSCGYSLPAYYSGPMVSAVIKGHQLHYGTSFSFLGSDVIAMDLSSNNLSGEIPEDIVGRFDLFSLNLSWNHLTGNIPNNIGAMKSLESLDLSRNKLSGEIPASLSNLTFLGYLDLSYNNLTGRIPSGSQLDSLYAYNPDMYDGNNGLCGAPLKKNCSSTDSSWQGDSRRNEEGHGLETFWFGLGLGFTVGLWVVFCTMLFNKPSRSAYFRHVDRLFNNAHVFVLVTWPRLTRKDTST
ncbi:hypothetical protein BS78_K092000 [Paspalum vaginatum]|uniref:Leucine-rich repeat-containing N-terminal plant-type domain-containing protein n=1 Tax=Paspalum vaginatum TaxID=158149 RepID=A0A9W7X6V3_9POAL|nr:hypothetical protein BS78_K092000 [Paspalum vaginatum]